MGNGAAGSPWLHAQFSWLNPRRNTEVYGKLCAMKDSMLLRQDHRRDKGRWRACEGTSSAAYELSQAHWLPTRPSGELRVVSQGNHRAVGQLGRI